MSCLQVKIAICYVIRIIPASYFERYVLKLIYKHSYIQLFFSFLNMRKYILYIILVICDVIYASTIFIRLIRQIRGTQHRNYNVQIFR